LKTLFVDLRPARAPHPPRAEPDPPGCPPGRVNLLGGAGSAASAQPILMCQRCHRTLVRDLSERQRQRRWRVAATSRTGAI